MFYRNVGQSWSEMLRGSFTASTLVTMAAHYLGLSARLAFIIGVVSTVLWPGLAVVCGWGIVRWRILHHTMTRERDNNPTAHEMLTLLRAIACNTARPLVYAPPTTENSWR